jgi:hypothetical protein
MKKIEVCEYCPDMALVRAGLLYWGTQELGG